jgi:hypothetical protein
MPEKNQKTGNTSTKNKMDNQGGDQGGSSNRGFAAMDPEKQRQIASEGGKASHKNDDQRGSNQGSNNRGGNQGGNRGGGSSRGG